MNDFQQLRIRKIRERTEIKQELSNSEENEGDFINSVTSLSHFNSQIIIKQEKCSTLSQAEVSVHYNKITSVTCQVKAEPQSEEEGGCEFESTAGEYAARYAIKQEIVEVYTEDHPMLDDEENHKKATKDEGSGTETNCITKSENDNWSPNFRDNNIDEQNNIFNLTKKMNKQRRNGKKTEVCLTQAETFFQTKKSHKCSVCAKTFQSSQAFLQHMWNIHIGEKPYTCEVCGKSFKYLRSLQLHKAVHSDERPFSCNVCNKAFKQKSVLRNHSVLCHSDERPYSCDMCDKTFKCKRDLHNHKMQCHSDNRRYSCEVCKKGFKRKNTLQIHKVLCHSDERPYSCDLCDKAFKCKRHVQNHKLSCHSDERPYSCDLCDKAFKCKTHVQNHKMQCHSNERPHSCDVCKKAFKQKCVLKRHKVLYHSIERPYSCDECEKTFKQKGNLYKHKRTVHSDEK